MCGNGHEGKEWEFAGRIFNVTFATDESLVDYGFNITVKFYIRKYY